MTTANLELPEFGSAGTPDGPTISEGNRALDAVVQLSVISDVLTTPPASPVQGDRYIPAVGSTGDWLGHDLQVAYYSQYGWRFRSPRNGWFAWLENEEILIWFDESLPGWRELVPTAVTDLSGLTFVTIGNETAVLPNSRRLVEGANVTINVATPGQAIISASASGSGTANVNADTHPSSANAADDEFEAGSAIDTTGARFSGATAWTAFNTGTVTVIAQGALALKPDLVGTRKVNGYTQPISGSWGYTCKLSVARWSTNSLIGMILATASGTGGNIIVFGLNGDDIVVQRLTNATTFSANSLAATNIVPAIGSPGFQSIEVYLRITYDGTTLRFLISTTGIGDSFVEVHNQTSAAFLGTPTLLGVGGDNESASVQAVGIYDWFRKTS